MKQFQSLALKPFSTVVLFLLFSLPVIAQKPKSEREFDRLKGAVKTEVIESAKITIVDGKQVEGARQITRVVNYDEAGNKTRVEYYEDGLLQKILVYSSLDGERVVRSRDLRESNAMTRGGGLRRLDSSLKPDTSFTISLKYKFDATGRRTEETVIDNEGKVNSREVNKYDDNGNLIERASYRGDRRLSTITYKLDSKGNVVEESHDTMAKYSYAYEEFDEKGNWIKRSITSVFKTRDKPSENHSVAYRKLSYY